MKRKAFIAVLILLLSVGCQLFSMANRNGGNKTPTTPPSATAQLPAGETPLPPTDTPIPPAETPSGAAITREMLENFTYQLGHTPDGRIPLQNGEYALNQENPPMRVTSTLGEKIAFGDLNGDGAEDAVVYLRTNTGGSGTFFDLVVLFNQGGAPVQAGSFMIGDRQVIKDLRVESGRIILDFLTQGPKDGLCCPSERHLRTYRVEQNGLSLKSDQLLADPNEQATPLPVQISIDQPAWGEKVTSPFTVSGRIDREPAQGFVEYHLSDFYGNLLQSGQIPIQQAGEYSAQVEFDQSAATIGILNLEVVAAENGILYGRSLVELLLP